MSTPDIEQLRQLVESTLSELGMPDADWSCVRAKSTGENRRPAEMPRKGVLAVWLTDRNEIEFHGENGTLLTTVVA